MRSVGETGKDLRAPEARGAVRTADRSVFSSGPAIVVYLALADLLIHLYASGHYGYFRDELYYLACSKHLDWGYVDQPPLIALIAYIGRALLGDSLRAIRFFPALAGAGKVLLAGLIARELGGRRFAQGLAALAVLVAPAYLGLDNLLTMNAFEPLFWMGCAYFVIRAIKTGNPREWLWFGVLAGLGLQNKHSMLFFGFGTFVGLLLTPQRRFFRNRWIWIAGGVAFLIFLPNLLWEIHRGFPTLELLENVKESGRNVSLDPISFMLQQIFFLNPLTFPIWLVGLGYYLFTREGKPYRPLGWTYLVIEGAMLVLKGRLYYPLPAYPMLFAGGAVLFEKWWAPRRRAWLKPAYILAMLLIGAILAPVFLPVLPVETYIRYSETLHLGPPRLEQHKAGPLPQIYADMFGWPEMAAAVARVYNSLPSAERPKTAIYTNNYGEAAAINFFGPKYGLPQAISGHQNYFYWGPRDYTLESVLVVGDDRESVEKKCPNVEQVGMIDNPYAMPYENKPILLCRGPNIPLKKIWPELKKWN